MYVIILYVFYYVIYCKYNCCNILDFKKFYYFFKRIFISLFNFCFVGIIFIFELEMIIMDNFVGKMFLLSVVFILILLFVFVLGGFQI